MILSTKNKPIDPSFISSSKKIRKTFPIWRFISFCILLSLFFAFTGATNARKEAIPRGSWLIAKSLHKGRGPVLWVTPRLIPLSRLRTFDSLDAPSLAAA
jgi:hypothetical protein